MWSSDRFYRTNSGEWVDVGLILDMLSTNRQNAVNKYMDFMAEEEKEKYEDYKVIGQTAETMDGNQARRNDFAWKELDEILLGTGVDQKNFELIKKGSRKRELTRYKLLYIKEALQANYTLKAIGINVRVSDTAVQEMVKRYNLLT